MRGRVTELARVSHARYNLALAVVLGRDLGGDGSVAGGVAQIRGFRDLVQWACQAARFRVRGSAQACAGA